MLTIPTNRKMIIIGAASLAAFAIIITVVAAIITRNAEKTAGPSGSANAPEGVPEEMLENQTPEAASATQAVINDIISGGAEVKTIGGAPADKAVAAESGKEGSGENAEEINKKTDEENKESIEKSPAVEEMKVVYATPLSSGIDVNTGNVVDSKGNEVKNDVDPSSPEAPQESAPISVTQVPSNAIKMTATAQGFLPAEFTVKVGQAVVLSVTSGDRTHVFKFNDPSLSAVAIGVAPEETRAITFNAPDKAGEYSFYCDVPGHAGRGETGKMIVK